MQLTIQQLSDVWIRRGGDRGKVVFAVAVAMAESGGETDIVSPSWDFGLWQINQVHEHDAGIDWTRIFDPQVNAGAAIDISFNGTNWAPWATCYTDIAASGWLGWLGSPQPGSAADIWVPRVSAALAVTAPTAPALPPVTPAAPPSAGEDEVEAGWQAFLGWHNGRAPSLLWAMQGIDQTIGGMFQ